MHGGNEKNINDMFNRFELTIFWLTFTFFTIGGLLITPFVQVYTKGINDAEYFQPILGIVLIIAEAVYCLQLPYNNIAYAANEFKKTRKPAYTEAIINVAMSVILVYKFGLIGVAIGTLVAMTYRLIYQIAFLRKNILNRKFSIALRKIIIFSSTSIICILLCYYLIPFKEINLINWIKYACIYTGICGFIFTSVSYLFYKDDIKLLLKMFSEKNNK